MDADELPPGWAWATLGELGQVSGGLTQNASRKGASIQIPFLRVGNVQSGVVDLSDLREIGVEESELPRTLLEAGDLLIVEGNGSIEQVGRCAIWTGKIQRCVHQNHIIKLRLSKCVSPSYVSHWLSSISGRARIERVASSTSGLHTLSISKIADLEIPLAPSVEQIKIVNEIKLLFDELVEAEAALARAREGVEQFRASLLHAACTGQLTAEWRAAHKPTETGADLLRRILAERRAAWERSERARLEAKGMPPVGNAWKGGYVDPPAVNSVEMPELPLGWTWVTLSHLIRENPRNGVSIQGSPNPPGVAALRLDALGENGLITDRRRYIDLHETRALPLYIEEGDFLVSRANGSPKFLARGCIAGSLHEKVIFPDTMIRFRFHRLVDPVWFALIWKSEFVRRQIISMAKTSAGILKVSQEDLLCVLIPVAPISEQNEISNIILKYSNLVDCIEFTRMKCEISSLRQSILHAAFFGKLVPQDPSDEPASTLLTRLRSAAALARHSRGRKPKVSA